MIAPQPAGKNAKFSFIAFPSELGKEGLWMRICTGRRRRTSHFSRSPEYSGLQRRNALLSSFPMPVPTCRDSSLGMQLKNGVIKLQPTTFSRGERMLFLFKPFQRF